MWRIFQFSLRDQGVAFGRQSGRRGRLGDQGVSGHRGVFFFSTLGPACNRVLPCRARPDERYRLIHFTRNYPTKAIDLHLYPSVPTPAFVPIKSIQHLSIMSSSRRHSISPRPSASHQRRNSLHGVIAEPAPRLMIQNEAEEEAGGSNALIVSTGNASHHPLGDIRLSTVINTRNGGAMSSLSSSLGQLGCDQTCSCSSTPFTLPFDLFVKIAQFVPPDHDQLDKLASVLPSDRRGYFFQCYMKENWSFLVHALSSDASQGTFSKRFPLWFSRNPNYLKVFETDTTVPARVREVLTDPVQAIVHGSVELLGHIFDNTDADINGMYVLSDDEPQSLLEIAILEDEPACVEYLLSRSDLDVHAVILHPGRDPQYLGTPVIFDILVHALSNPEIVYYFKCVLAHPSCDVNRSHALFTDISRMNILDDAVSRTFSVTDLDDLPLYLLIIDMILYLGGGIPFLSSDADELSPLEVARWFVRNGTPQEARIGQMVFELFDDFIRQPGRFERLEAAAAAYR